MSTKLWKRLAEGRLISINKSKTGEKIVGANQQKLEVLAPKRLSGTI